MNQVAFDFFETSADPDREPGFIALGPNARQGLKDGDGPGSAAEDVLLGELVWYSVSDAVRLSPEKLAAALTAANLDPKRLVPRLPTPPSALSRAAEAAEIKAGGSATIAPAAPWTASSTPTCSSGPPPAASSRS